MNKMDFIGASVFLLFKELSFAQCILLEALVVALVYFLGSGGALLGGALPLWATAAGMAGLAVVLLGTVRMGKAKVGVTAVLVVATCMLQIGSANILISDATEHAQIGSAHLPSLSELTQFIGWLLVLGSTFAGVGVGAAYVAWSRARRTETRNASAPPHQH